MAVKNNEKIYAYTDGAAIGNGKDNSKCGWGVLLSFKGNEKRKSGSAYGRTNNYMEMWAVLEAMRSIKNKNIPVEIMSDSKYAVETMNGNYQISKNEELWRELIYEKDKFSDITFSWVKGHSGNRGNEIANNLAQLEAENA